MSTTAEVLRSVNISAEPAELVHAISFYIDHNSNRRMGMGIGSFNERAAHLLSLQPEPASITSSGAF